MKLPLGLYVTFPTESGIAKGFVVHQTSKYCYVFVEEGTPDVKKTFRKEPPSSISSQGRGLNPDAACAVYYPKNPSAHSKFYIQDMETGEVFLYKQNLGRGSCYAENLKNNQVYKTHAWRFREISEAEALQILASTSNTPTPPTNPPTPEKKATPKSEIVVGGSVSWAIGSDTKYGIVISIEETGVRVFSEGQFLILNKGNLEGFGV